MGYQPGLDGLRAVSVMAVLLYHAGFGWMRGGFFGVEVFFVVSGYLITTLLIEERDRESAISLRKFWVRRIHRLVPALVAMLLAVGVWGAVCGSDYQQTQLRRDYPWAIFYSANWGQIFSKVEYFAGTPTLLRHLWSLGVEEQWYIVWPLAFVVIAKFGGSARRKGIGLVAAAVSVMVATAIAMTFDWPSRFPNPWRWQMQQVDTHNFLYLSTFSRSSGLLLGAGLAFLWRPWRKEWSSPNSRVLPTATLAAVGVLLASFVWGHVASDGTYYFVLPAVTVASAVLIMRATQRPGVLANRYLVAIGQRSYGLYLWSWPISRICNAYTGSYAKFALAALVAVPVAEVSHRYIETPIRRGALRRRWVAGQRSVLLASTAFGLAGTVMLGFVFASADPVFDFGKDTRTDVQFTSSVPAAPSLPRNLAIVGDSTARALVNNMPAGVEQIFTISDGSVIGCSVYVDGEIITAREGHTRDFGTCSGWATAWAYAATRADADIALVVLGAWDIFDQKLDGRVIKFASQEFDQRFLDGVQQGIDALDKVGARAALLEVPCMRPKDIDPAGVVALPERAMDDRVAHVNDLLRRAAAADPTHAVFISGPTEYCADPVIAKDSTYRWDGVHAYKLGANLTMMAITNQLLAIPAR